jgi:hypothetical protein
VPLVRYIANGDFGMNAVVFACRKRQIKWIGDSSYYTYVVCLVDRLIIEILKVEI